MQSHESSVCFPCSFGFDKLQMVLQARRYETGRFVKRKMLSVSKAIRYFGHFTLAVVLVATIGCGESEDIRLRREELDDFRERAEQVFQENRETFDKLNEDMKRINEEDY